MKHSDLFQQAANNAGFVNIYELASYQTKPSRIMELMSNPLINPDGKIETSKVFEALPESIKIQIRKLPTEDLKVACAAYLADDLPEVIALLP